MSELDRRCHCHRMIPWSASARKNAPARNAAGVANEKNIATQINVAQYTVSGMWKWYCHTALQIRSAMFSCSVIPVEVNEQNREELEKLLHFVDESVEIHIGVQGEPFLYDDMIPLIEDLQKRVSEIETKLKKKSKPSFVKEDKSAPTKPWVFAARSTSLTSFFKGILLVCIFKIFNRPSLLGTPILISRSNLPGLRSAGSKEFGLFVAAMTITFPRDFKPSIMVKSWETILRSTSPYVSSRFGAIASISSMKIIEGAFFSASSNFLRRFCSDCP